ncbi:DNA repair protein RadA [Protaetiibacter mangrovi]|uniref:DNA repair protein RadA n=1 Tax=Protaetiibacter mangrovi TaxID=2970926 RepID=A0ABT1ZCU6_9MICO|nr:DNA repair protein RadA [Protaetiibacter mangrovi]MCS0498514.1 DNA repair protein RadA [Protaetiibacter mangrovi]TPX02850.1 DNA repair protein RadA [Schumannella luteola]
MARPAAPGFSCAECGWTGAKWFGRCPECQAWGSIVERGAPTTSVAPASVPAARAAKPITAHVVDDATHRPTGIGEFDRVLGGGLVPGAAVLVSGEPGVGKSTLLLEVAARVARRGARVLYVSGEESAGQVRLRAERTGALDDELYLASETDLATVLGHVDAVRPGLLVIDSVQTIASAQSDGAPGQPAQVREVAGTLIRVAKERGIPLLLVGHVTKDGSIAGPRVLEHLVDVVLSFDGDRQTALRFVRALKNRFGPTDEAGCFEMTGDGIAEVPDPSGLFLSRSATPVAGTCVTVALEGRRALPVEVQALVVGTSAPNPRRVVSGVDGARVAMLLAVLEKRCRLTQLAQSDVYVSTVGGIRLAEPAADLAIALAIASAVKDTPLPRTLAAIGEISLAGEVRPVAGGRQRSAEGARLGYRTIIDAEVGSLQTAESLAFSAPGLERVEAPAF